MRKVIFVVLDGLGDRPVKELRNLTPLEAAKTPNLDRMAEKGITGIMDVIGVGVRPGSDTAHLSLFGYELEKFYPGRGPFEVKGIGMNLMEGDICFRANIGTVDKNGMVIDRRAGRIDSTKPFVKALNGMKVNGVKFLLKEGTAHRMGMIMRGKKLSAGISDVDPHETGKKVLKARALEKGKEAEFTARTLNEFLVKAQGILEKLPVNKNRKLKGNYLLVRGAGKVREIPSFKERYKMKGACIAGAGLYKGIASMLGMKVAEVKGATGTTKTNVKAKFVKARKLLKEYDFVFVHVKGTDTLGEDGNWKGKKEFIQKIDKGIKELNGIKNALVVVTADHSTPCELKAHSGDPVPVLITGEGVRKDKVKEFGERACSKGGMNRIKGLGLMKEIINLSGRAELKGD